MSAAVDYARPHEAFEAHQVRQRSLTRAEYDDARLRVFRLGVEAALLQPSMPKAAAADRAYANRVRMAIAVPLDPIEAARNRRWHNLHLGLQASARAVVLRNQARRIARDGVAP